MFKTQRNIVAFAYLAGAFGFAFYDAVVQAHWSAVAALSYGAQWPLSLVQMI